MVIKNLRRSRRDRFAFFGLLVIDRLVTEKGAELYQTRIRTESQLKFELMSDIVEKRAWTEAEWTSVMESLGTVWSHPAQPFEKKDRDGYACSTIALPIFLSTPSRNLLRKISTLLKSFNDRDSSCKGLAKACSALILICGGEDETHSNFVESLSELVTRTSEIVARVPQIVPLGKSELDMLKPEQ